jgi:hypothetical protein
MKNISFKAGNCVWITLSDKCSALWVMSPFKFRGFIQGAALASYSVGGETIENQDKYGKQDQ